MGMIPNALLISQTSHVSSTSAFANGTARLSGITAEMPAGTGGVPGVNEGAGAAGMLGLEGAAGLEGTWMWASGSLGGAGGVAAGPSCITTGMQD
jgi:hypothetical protein